MEGVVGKILVLEFQIMQQQCYLVSVKTSFVVVVEKNVLSITPDRVSISFITDL